MQHILNNCSVGMKKIQAKLLDLSQGRGAWLFGIFAILLFSGYFLSLDMFIPSLPTIEHQFGSSDQLVRFLISSFLVTMALSQLIYGPASDKYGRKPVILLGIVIYAIGSLLCYRADNMSVLLTGRVIQGLGVGALVPIARTILQDVVDRDRFIKLIAWLSLVFMFAPAIAPVIGGYIQKYGHWQDSFKIMLIMALLMFLIIWLIFPETHSREKRNHQALKPKQLFGNYGMMLIHGEFVALTTCIIMGSGGVMIFYTIGPFILIKQLGMSPAHFGLLSSVIVLCAFIGRLYMSLMMKIIAKKTILFQGIVGMISGAFFLIGVMIIAPTSSVLIIIGMILYAASASIIMPIIAGFALSLFQKNKGAAGALYSFLQSFGVFILSFVAALVPANLMSLALMLALMALTALLSFINALRYRQKTQPLPAGEYASR
ncbi:MAG: multidrug effflux MFS transporter [Francisellaceae bacterium]